MNIYVLLCWNFILLVIIVNVFVLLFVWWVLDGWFDQFFYYIEVNYFIFVLVILISVGIVLIFLSYQVVKIVLVNLIKVIWYE